MPACIVPLLTDPYQHDAIAAMACELYDSHPDVRLWVSGEYHTPQTHCDIHQYIARAKHYPRLSNCLEHWMNTEPHDAWILSDFNEPNYYPLMRKASKTHCITPVFIECSFDYLCPNTGWQSVTNPITHWFGSRIIHTQSADLRARYHHIQSINRSRLNYTCQQLGMVAKWSS
ncbi:hypothetical protein N8762_00455 [Candidatus Marinamargulisbacteria bacterium]|jgi:hypothetical protein|nr:hypothetical protein [Candidatus Marinamargulisbacteria bacterium]MDG2265131.1 hypothetical protein [Candidatus Marinamargulisbacteria bacterium]